MGDINPDTHTHLESTSGMATPTATTHGSNRGQYEEVASQWELAKIMEVTSDLDQSIIINKLIDMEDRDNKEAEDLGDSNTSS